jgi:uncharacterized membrane-anchored protein
MRSRLIAALILCQLLVLGFMAAKREYILVHGTEIYLRTAPVDPRDPLRGDFVRLRYPMSAVRPRQTRGAVMEHRNSKDYTVYAVLRTDAGGLHVLDYLTDEKPASSELFIRGYITNDWRLIGWTAWNGAAVHARYGIEQYFVEQGQGLAMEEKMGQRNGMQVPLEVRVAIGGDGTAVIKDYRWSALGIGLEILRPGNRPLDTPQTPPGQPLSPRVKVTLQNASPRPLALADPGDHCGFRLGAAEWEGDDYPMADTSCEEIGPDRSSLITLQAGQEYAVELELSAPRWHVMSEDGPREIGALPGQNMFRVVYRSPDSARIKALGADYNIWPGELPSRAFNASGNID